MARQLTAEKITELFDYKSDGLYWKNDVNHHVKKGDKAGNITNHGYRVISIDRTRYLEHVLIWVLNHGNIDDGFIVHHKDENKLNNKLDNLRLMTSKEHKQHHGISGILPSNKSGHVGVSRNNGTKKWRASIQYNGKSIYLGVFDDIQDAIKARKDAEVKYFTEATWQ